MISIGKIFAPVCTFREDWLWPCGQAPPLDVQLHRPLLSSSTAEHRNRRATDQRAERSSLKLQTAFEKLAENRLQVPYSSPVPTSTIFMPRPYKYHIQAPPLHTTHSLKFHIIGPMSILENDRS